LLEKAQQFFINIVLDDSSLESQPQTSRSAIGSKIVGLLKTIEIDYEKLNETQDEMEDDDRWMHVKETEFDALLMQKFLGHDLAHDQRRVPEALNRFLESESGLKGAERIHSPPVPPVRRNRKAKSTHSDDTLCNSKISFESENFSDAIRSVLTLQVPHSDDDGSSSGMSDYSEESDTQSLNSDDEEDELNLMRNKRNKLGKANGKSDSLVDDMKTYMDKMDRELAKTKVGESFERRSQSRPPLATTEELDEEADDYKPVDLDMNALKNILESLNSQNGMPGPSASLLHTMGLNNVPNAKSGTK